MFRLSFGTAKGVRITESFAYKKFWKKLSEKFHKMYWKKSRTESFLVTFYPATLLKKSASLQLCSNSYSEEHRLRAPTEEKAYKKQNWIILGKLQPRKLPLGKLYSRKTSTIRMALLSVKAQTIQKRSVRKIELSETL